VPFPFVILREGTYEVSGGGSGEISINPVIAGLPRNLVLKSAGRLRVKPAMTGVGSNSSVFSKAHIIG
jgi:hypothetical protein